MCFTCGPIAHILQRAGHDIKPRAEDEQAAVMIWMIRKYQEHGEGWRAKADDELNALKKAKHSRSGRGPVTANHIKHQLL
jgi:hypothetical protein